MATQEEVKNDPNYRALLDYGFVGLVSHMGDDAAIVQAARVSYGAGTKKVSEDRGLIRYLVRHIHTSPLEMVEFKFHCKMPIFVARQWIRHRTANVNEYSGRYSEIPNEMYVPLAQDIQPQSVHNKQGRDGILSNEDSYEVRCIIFDNNADTFQRYEDMLGKGNEHFSGIARETARMVLPLNTYTEWYWKIDLHNLFHFLKLRMDKHAQMEIRVFAEAMYDLIKPIVPFACEAFEDYIFDVDDGNYSNYVMSKNELKYLRMIAQSYLTDVKQHETLDHQLKSYGLTSREVDDFKKKFKI